MLSNNSSFWALKFDVDEEQLKKLDIFEGVPSRLYNRVEVEILLKNNRLLKCFIYVPTKKTIHSQNLSPETDKNDKWKEEIKKFPEIVNKFHELVM
ncbi:MAG: gamma-glutamylcyclotransferase family protein [Promethearchaeota archaeon]